MPTDSATKPAEAKAEAKEPETVKLRYLGSSHELVDPQTGKTFQAGGKPHVVPVEAADRLEALPYEEFERVAS